MATTYSGNLVGTGMRIAIVAARFNGLLVESLREGAREGLLRHGVSAEDIDEALVPGAFELPLVADRLARSDRYDAVVCLGVVIRGETPHFDYVAGQAASGIAGASLGSGRPVIFGVLTCDTVDQALQRSGTKAGNKGYDAAAAAIEMVDVLRQIDG